MPPSRGQFQAQRRLSEGCCCLLHSQRVCLESPVLSPDSSNEQGRLNLPGRTPGEDAIEIGYLQIELG